MLLLLLLLLLLPLALHSPIHLPHRTALLLLFCLHPARPHAVQVVNWS
jgi:hypothetical protein